MRARVEKVEILIRNQSPPEFVGTIYGCDSANTLLGLSMPEAWDSQDSIN